MCNNLVYGIMFSNLYLPKATALEKLLLIICY